jgi:hypothetical protein
MSNSKCYSIVTEKLLKMQSCIDNNDREGFMKEMDRVQINNCSCGDSFLQQNVQKVYANALEKFLI